MRFLKTVLLLWLWVLLGVTGYRAYLDGQLVAVEWWNAIRSSPFSRDQYQKFDQIYSVLDAQFLKTGSLDTGAMLQRALWSFVDALNDPYTVYLTNEANEWLQEVLQWSQDFEWIGAVVSKKDQWVLIEEVLKWSPAFLAWLQPLDLIVEVGGTWTQALTLQEAVNLIRGPMWSEVSLLVLRTRNNEDPEILEIIAVRDTIVIPSVESELIRDVDPVTSETLPVIGYVTISVVGEETNALFTKELNILLEENIEGLIIDVRWNGGGLLHIAVDIVSHFVSQWALISSATYRTLQDEDFFSKGYGTIDETIPVVVLVDGLTASAWEIIALALDELRDAITVWTKTFGKWSIQTLKDFRDGSSLKYTIGRWYSPLWTTIDEVWYLPEKEILFDTDLYREEWIDNQLQAATTILYELVK